MKQPQSTQPCPWCGCRDLEMQVRPPGDKGIPVSMVCNDCGASGPWDCAPPGQTVAQQEQLALLEWNARYE